jgi:cation transport regulator ChaC
MLYFAYGSNLDPDQMAERCPGHRVVGRAALHDHRLFFPLFSNRWNGGVASIQLHHGGTVWGILYDLTDDDVKSLDGYEGFRGAGDQHNLYDRVTLTVDIDRPDDGSIPRRVRCETYVARPSNPSPPSRRYLDAILKGARHHRLPEEYAQALAAIAVRVEEDPARPSP